METRIIHNREVYINEDGKVIFDIDGKVPFNKVFNVWWNVSGWYTPEYIRKREKLGRIKWKDVDCPKDGVSLERNCMECEHFPDNEGKENFNNEPRQVIQLADFYGSFPACPACQEPAYDDTRCHFCGQPYTWPEPDPEDRPTIKGGHYAENGEVVCDACGCADLQFVYHADGKDRYGNGYNCAKCGAVVQMIFKRR